MDKDDRMQRLRTKAMKLPLTPGVYIMRNKQGKIIYIGKAKALKNRVSQYFGSQNRHPEKVLRMVENVEDFETILTDSEFEALVLECSLIKQHFPKYNILLKDDKGYHYIKITRGSWPRISAANQTADDDADYLGPYTSSFTVTQTVDEISNIFKLPRCSKVFPRDIGKGRPCLNYFIGKCSAPCSGKIKEAEYRQTIKEALEYLKYESAESIKKMQEEMELAAEDLDFEKAARLRDRIAAIRKLYQKQKVVDSKVKEQDIFALIQTSDAACLEVFRFLGGRLADREHFILEAVDDPEAARAELITRYYSMRDRIPPRIALDGELRDSALIEEWLLRKAGKKVAITIPQIGDQAKLVELCRTNAAEHLAQQTGRGTGREMSALDELQKLLGLSEPPDYIEAYDISHTAGSDNVGAMVVFRSGKPYKQAYRKFAVKGFEGQDDYASMREVMERRLNRYEEEKDSGQGFGKLPDLILLDGGQGQISAVLPALEAHGLNVPVFGMVKDDKHRTRAIASGGGEIAISSIRRAFTLISQIQDEVHRFAIDYHRKKHQKRTFASSLQEIEGIGSSRASLLLKHFKTMKAIRGASVDELVIVKGISKPAAQAVYDHFHPEQGTEPGKDEDVHEK